MEKLNPEQIAHITSICLKSNVTHHYDEKSDTLTLNGILKSAGETKATILEYLLKNTHVSSLSFPKEWVPQTNPIETPNVPKDSPEWQIVETHFKKTLPQSTITSIQRIQNQILWERYSNNSRFMTKRLGPKTNEQYLFHGTSKTDPSLIYASDTGFDMRYCTSGMWGIAIYFAVNASYSTNYCYTTPTGEKQMFLAQVLVGEDYATLPDNKLKKPPLKQVDSGGIRQDYDSVSGETGNSKVYMIYENGRAYPKYLISYKI
uniref:Poly [ADP-ribose] polymerase n=1 Tax=Arcella intermedia TaxID=1963864 RepID=A0A6B2LD09_9EUKA